MARRLILDTNTLIAFERRQFDATKLDGDDLAIAAITVAEFRVGALLARSAEKAASRARAIDVIVDTIAVLEYTERTAREHARLLAHVRTSGLPRGAHDLIIAAHAIAEDRAILALDGRARFNDLPGVRSLDP